MFEFNEKEKNIKITLGSKEYNLFFNEAESYNNILKVVMNISEAEDELLDEEELDKVSQFLYEDKIMGGDLKNTPLFCKSDKDLALLEIKIENLKRAKQNAEEKWLIYQSINSKNDLKEEDKNQSEENEKKPEENIQQEENKIENENKED